MKTPLVEIAIHSPAWEALPDLSGLAGRAVAASCKATGARLAQDCEICVTFCDDAEIQALNAHWRETDKPTNVLSFPTPGPLAEKLLLGDIVVGYETVAREALEQGKSLSDHVAHMIVHGFLHLIGYDHEAPEEAETMEALERRAAETLGIADPYEGTLPVFGAGLSKGDVNED
jgi:probable rRNA maturation factor